MGLFSALSGKTYRFNLINIPVDNGIAQKIKELEDTPERFLLIGAFGMTQKMIGEIFHPDHGMFKKSLDYLTKKNLENIYYILLNLSVSLIKKLPLNIYQEDLINDLSKITSITNEKLDSIDINGSYENICNLINLEQNSQNTILFFKTFMKIYEEIVEKIGNAVFNNNS